MELPVFPRQNAQRSAYPCSARWETMQGDERVRVCNECGLHVYNVAGLEAEQAASLMAKQEGQICQRVFQRADKTLLTKNCPLGLRVSGSVSKVAIVLGPLTSSPNGTIEGDLRDAAGAPVVGARIVLTRARHEGEWSVLTDESGWFRITPLLPGRYAAEVRGPGLRPGRVTGLTFAAGEVKSLSMTLDGGILMGRFVPVRMLTLV